MADDDSTFTEVSPAPQTPADTSVLWGASITGILNKLPTREGAVDQGRALDALETISGLVLARVGSTTALPAGLENLGAKVIETGAAAMVEQGDFPEQSTDKGSLAQVLWGQYGQLLDALQAGVEALGGDPAVSLRPAYVFPPPLMLRYQQF
jgi:hypothetical protein